MRRLVPPRLYGDHVGQLAHFTRVLSSGCWEFTGYILPTGYGQLGKNKGAHRIAWETVDLSCNDDNQCAHRRCVNPAHLEAVTEQVNITRGRGFSGANAVKTHCAQGHEFTAMNTYYRPDRFGRMCRTCRAAAGRRAAQKSRAAA